MRPGPKSPAAACRRRSGHPGEQAACRPGRRVSPVLSLVAPPARLPRPFCWRRIPAPSGRAARRVGPCSGPWSWDRSWRAAYSAGMVMACAVCGRPLPDGARFCPNCGAAVGPLVGTEERKMVTVLFADIVDSTGLGRRLDAERAREVLGQFFGAAAEELLALRGHPEKFIGDAVMAVFGLPAVHEDDALRAVRARLAIRRRTPPLGEAAGPPPAVEGPDRV